MYVQAGITVFNKRLGNDRRELYYPTCIRKASYWASKGSSQSSGVRSESVTAKFRIPFNAKFQGERKYVDAAVYKAMETERAENVWTLQEGDYVLVAETNLDSPVDAKTVSELGAHDVLILIKDYADNTIRGSNAVKHWRIGGE